MKDVKDKVNAKITMMLVVLGLIVAANTLFTGTAFLYLFDTVCFAALIVILFGVKKDTKNVSTPKERRKIYAVLLGVVFGITLVLAQFVPRPYVYVTDIMGIVLAFQMYRGYRFEDSLVNKFGK
jgi:uncharacterized membrane protein